MKRSRRPIRTLSFLLAGLLLLAGAVASRSASPHLFIATADRSRGSSTRMELEAPWGTDLDVEPAGVETVVRSFLGMHYLVNRHQGTVQVVDPATLETVRELDVGAGSEPRDILVVGPRKAYVSCWMESSLRVIDPSTGAPLDSVDLGPFADADGLPEMAMMARDGERLLVQLQRVDQNSRWPVPPSYLAVIDISTNAVVDADPGEPGTQAIKLQGTIPQHRMHVDRSARRLFVCAPGPTLDSSGGIEEIDLDALRSLGYILPEAADLGPFVMTSADGGYVAFHTDIAPSSHLVTFDRSGITSGEIVLTFDVIRSLAYDPVSEQVFFPDTEGPETGIVVVDARTGAVLTPLPVPTGLPPRDLVVYRGPPTPGESRGLRVGVQDAAALTLELTYEPACSSTSHNLVYGPLEGVDAYLYSGVECDIGASGSYRGFSPGDGSFFFLVAGTDGEGREGSYGRGATGERPAPDHGAGCPFGQDLSSPCS